MRARSVFRLMLVALALVGLLVTQSARAKGTYDSLYGFERTWNAAFRLVRVDRNLKVTEKDESVGYIFFEYKSPAGGKPSQGSIELVRGQRPTDPVRVVVQLPEMPSHHEVVLVQELSRKLRNDYGEPRKLEPREKEEKDKEKEKDGKDKDAGSSE